ncbi:MAG: L,D-transpeptidase family protein [Luteolibacter sp.]
MKSKHEIVVDIDTQKLHQVRNHQIVASFDVSTAEKGMGFVPGSERTPVGRFRICEKIGAGAAIGTIFKARRPVGIWHPGDPCDEDLVLTRILRLDGLDPQNQNTRIRYIYIHGTNYEKQIGQAAGHGCIRMRNHDIVDLFDTVEEGDELIIEPARQAKGKLAFLLLDGILSRLHGVDELIKLARETSRIRIDDRVTQAMLSELLGGSELVDRVVTRMSDALHPTAKSLVQKLYEAGWMTVMISCSPIEIARPLAHRLGVRHLEAPVFDSIAGHFSYPYVGSQQMLDVLLDWKAALLPAKTLAIGLGGPGWIVNRCANSFIPDAELNRYCDMQIQSLDGINMDSFAD